MYSPSMHRFVNALILSIILLVICPLGVNAQKVLAPTELEPWQGWVSHQHKDKDCPHSYNDKKRQCHWPGTLNLNIQKDRAAFTLTTELFAKSWVPLPGNLEYWPLEVKTREGGQEIAVVNHNGIPSVWLAKGHHTINGIFAWVVMPKAIRIPTEIGILHLSINGQKIQHPDRTKTGIIHLHNQQTSKILKTEDSLEIQVFRKISDSIPMLITTHIDLKVAGSNREISLGALIPGKQTPVSLRSRLPVRIDPSQQIRTQIRPGHWVITLITRINESVTEINLPKSNPPWPREEIWSFEAQNQFRTVTIKDGLSIDPSQTSLPKKWHGLPSYLVKQDTPLVIETRKRGNENPAPDNLSLKRTIWLDEAGDHYTVKDEISGTMQNSWRLEMQESGELGRVSMNGVDQLITKREDSNQAGVEVRHGKINLSAVSRIKAGDLNIAGWDHDFGQVQGILNLPPGWRLLATTGVDQTSSWLKKWTLLDLFLVLLIVLAMSKLFGLPSAAATLLTLVLIYHEPNAPRWIWPNLLITIGLLRVIPPGKFNTIITVYLRLCLGFLVILSIPFMVQEAHWSLYPQLAQHNDYSYNQFQDFFEADTDDNAGSINPMESEAVMSQNIPQKSSYRTPRSVTRKLMKRKSPQQYFKQDPSAHVQTGPGLPSWHWQKLHLTWNGPVQAEQPLRLILISPLSNRILGFARVAFLAVLILIFLRKHLKMPKIPDFKIDKAQTQVLVFMTLLLIPLQARASDIPSQQLLKEYESRLFSPPECLPECAAIASMDIVINEARLSIKLNVHSYSDTYIPLPTSSLWEADKVTLNRRPATLRRDNKGLLWVQCAEGIHTINMAGALPAGRDIPLSLPLLPHQASFMGEGFEIDGLNQNHRPGQNIQLRKIVSTKNTSLASFEPGNLPPQLVVDRTLRFGMEWSMDTTVRRLSPTGAPVLVKIPLLDFESVTTQATIKDKEIQATLPANGRSFSWTSSLKQRPELTLIAHPEKQWTEVWRLDISPMWHVETTGIPATHDGNINQSRQPTWHPWPSESLAIKITKPAAIQGETFTIDGSLLRVEPGQRSSESTLTIQARSSKGGQHTITMPAQATLKGVKINGRVEPIRMQGNQVMVPISPGKQRIELNWIDKSGIGLLYKAPQLELGIDSVNAQIEMAVPRSRWVLFIGGPQTGPAILFWAEFLVILLISLGLGRIPFTPLRSWQWMLLAGGLSQAGLAPTAFVVLWLLALGARKEFGSNLKGSVFNLQQCAMVMLTLVAGLSLFYAVHNGLLGRPQMQIEGNDSSTFLLKWYQDRFSAFPQPWFISAPLLVFRLSMLAWALWLAFSVLGWLRWGWDCFAKQSLWKKVKRVSLGKSKETPQKNSTI